MYEIAQVDLYLYINPGFDMGRTEKSPKKTKEERIVVFGKPGSINKCYVFNPTLKPPPELRFTVLGHPKTRTRSATTSDQ